MNRKGLEHVLGGLDLTEPGGGMLDAILVVYRDPMPGDVQGVADLELVLTFSTMDTADSHLEAGDFDFPLEAVEKARVNQERALLRLAAAGHAARIPAGSRVK